MSEHEEVIFVDVDGEQSAGEFMQRSDSERALGELALGSPEPTRPFGVSPEAVIAIAPSVAEGGAAVMALLRAFNPGDKRLQPDGEVSPEITEARKQFNRGDMRRGQSQYGPYLARIIQTGAQYIATFDDLEEGAKAGREIFGKEVDDALHNIYAKRIIPAAEPLRDLRKAALDTTEDVRKVIELGDAGLADRYTIFKALGYNRHEGKTNLEKREIRLDSPEPEFTLTSLYALGGSNLHDVLRHEVQAGAYDRLIAHDILTFITNGGRVNGELEKIQQLMQYSYALKSSAGSTSELLTDMVGAVDHWPFAQRQVIAETRELLLDRMQRRLSTLSSALRKDGLIVDNPREAFDTSVTNLATYMLRTVVVTPENKAEIMQLRAQYAKRGRTTSKRGQRRASRRGEGQTADENDTALAVEAQREPAKIVVCNLASYGVEEDTTAMIDEFVTAASQGNVTVRQDVEKMLTYMARRDLPPAHRRGIKPIEGARVRFGTDGDPDKLWDFYEFKPTEAAGLSLRTNIVKNSRVYFIKLTNDSLGIIGIKPRADQDSFLRTIRIKTKRRGEE